MASNSLRKADGATKFDTNVDTQQKVFTKWINSHLNKIGSPPIKDVLCDLQSGQNLINLLSALTEDNLPVEESNTRQSNMANVKRSLEIMQETFKMPVSGIVPEDVVDGSEQATLSLVWSLMVHWHWYHHVGLYDQPDQAETLPSINQMTLDLLDWCKRCTQGYHGVNIANFTSSWRDGLGFLALIHYHKSYLFHFESRMGKIPVQNISLALHLANENYDVDRLLDPEDVSATDVMDSRAVICYLWCLRHAMEEEGDDLNSESSQGSTPRDSACLENEPAVTSTMVSSAHSQPVGAPPVLRRTVDLPSYQNLVKVTLGWLGEAEERLGVTKIKLDKTRSVQDKQEEEGDPDEQETRRNQAVLDRHETLRLLFEENENFMNFLAGKQDDLARALQDGKTLLSPDRQLTQTDRNDVTRQSGLLTSRWDKLRHEAVTSQECLHAALTGAQDILLDRFGELLDKMEGLRCENLTIGPYINNLKVQLELNRTLECSIEANEALATQLQQVIVFSDSEDDEDDEELGETSPTPSQRRSKRHSKRRSSTGSSAGQNAVEGRIEMLAMRWSQLTEGVRTRYTLLQDALLKWRQMEEEETLLADWLADQELEARSLVDRRANEDTIKNWLEMAESRWSHLFRAMEMSGSAVREACGENDATSKEVEDRMEAMLTRWTNLTDLVLTSGEESGMDIDECPRLPSSQTIPVRVIESNNRVRPSPIPVNADGSQGQGQMINAKKPRMDSSSSPGGSTYRQEFESTVERLMAWLDTAEEHLEMAARINSPSGNVRETLSRCQDQGPTIARIGTEMEEWNSSLDRVRRLGQRYKEELVQDGEQVEEIDQLFEEVDERWCGLDELYTNARNSHIAISKVKQFYDTLASFKDQHMGYAAWLQTATVMIPEDTSDLRALVSSLDERLSTMRSLDSQLKTITQLCSETQTSTEVPKTLKTQVQTDLNEFKEMWGANYDEYVTKRSEVESLAGPSVPSNEGVERLMDWLDEMEQTLKSERIFISGLESLETQQDHYDHIQEEFQQHTSSYKFLESEAAKEATQGASSSTRGSSDELTSSSSRPRVRRLSCGEQFSEAKTKWRAVNTKLDKRISFLTDLYDKLKHLLTQLEGMEKWMTDMSEYLESVDQADLSTPDLAEAQLAETEAALADMRSLQPTLNNIKALSDEIEAYFSKEYQSETRSRIQTMLSGWNQMQSTAQFHYTRLEEQLKRLQSGTTGPPQQLLTTAIDDDDEPITDLEDEDIEIAAVTATIPVSSASKNVEVKEIDEKDKDCDQSSDDDEVFCSPGEDDVNDDTMHESRQRTTSASTESLLEWVDNSKKHLNDFNVIESEEQLTILEKMVQSIEAEFHQREKTLNRLSSQETSGTPGKDLKGRQKLEDLRIQVAREKERCRAAGYQFEDFRSLINEEGNWIRKAKNSITRSISKTYIDAEDIAGDIDEIEQMYYQHSDEDFDQINDLKKSLLESKVLTSSVSGEFEDYKSKVTSTKEELKGHLAQLQTRLDRVQSIDRRCGELSNWAVDVQDQLKSRLNADFVGEDLPEEFAALQTEFSQYEELLKDLRVLAEENRKAKNTEAAERLERMRETMESTIEPVRKMFLRFSRPSDFEPRMVHVKRELERITDQVHLLDIIGLDPEDLENSLQHCQKFEASLQALHSEMDHVISIGKVLTANRQVEFPERVSGQLDNLRTRWDSLKDQITKSKDKLESAIPFVKELRRYSQEVERCCATAEETDDYLESIHGLDTKLQMLEKLLDDLKFQASRVPRVDELCESIRPLAEDMEMVNDAFTDIREANEKLQQFIDAFEQKRQDIENERNSNQKTFVTIMNQLHDMEAEINQCLPLSLSQSVTSRLDSLYTRLEGVKEAAVDLVGLTSTHQDRLDSKIANVEESLLDVNKKITANGHHFLEEPRSMKDGISLAASMSLSSVGSCSATSIGGGRPGGDLVKALRREIDDQVKRVVLVSKEATAEACSQDLEGQIQIFLDFIPIFKGQNRHFSERLAKLEEIPDLDKDELADLEDHWHKVQDKLESRFKHVEDVKAKLLELDRTLTEMERYPTEQNQEQAYLLLRDLECEGYELKSERHRLDYQPVPNLLEPPSPTPHLPPPPPIKPSPSPEKEGGLKEFREATRQVTQRLNGVRVELDQLHRGELKGPAVKHIESELEGCRDDLTHIHDVIQSINRLLSTTELFNFGCLLDAQKKRHVNYTKELRTNQSKWIDNAQRWQDFVDELERHKLTLTEIETSLSAFLQRTNSKDFAANHHESSRLKKIMSTFHERLLQLENDGQTLSTHCTDTEAQFVKDSVSDLKSRFHAASTALNGVASLDPSDLVTRGTPISVDQSARISVDSENNNTISTPVNKVHSNGNQGRLPSTSADDTDEVTSEDDAATVATAMSTDHMIEENMSTVKTSESQSAIRSIDSDNDEVVEESTIHRQHASLALQTTDIDAVDKPSKAVEPQIEDEDGEAVENFLAEVDRTMRWLEEKKVCLVLPPRFPSPAHINFRIKEMEQVENQLKAESGRVQQLCESGDTLLDHPPPGVTEAELSLVQDRADALQQAWNTALMDLPERQMLLANQRRLWEETDTRSGLLLNWLVEQRQGIETKNAAWLLDQMSETGSRYNDLTLIRSNMHELSRQCDQVGFTVPDHLASRVDQAVREWSDVYALAQNKAKITENGEQVDIMSDLSHKRRGSRELTSPLHQGASRDQPMAGLSSQKFNQDYETLSQWLGGVNDFLRTSVVTLGDRFEQDTVGLHVKHDEVPSSNSSFETNGNVRQSLRQSMNTIQHYLHEMVAREAILERITLEEEKLSSVSSRSSDMQRKIKSIRQQWNSTSSRLHSRAAQLDRMSSQTARLERVTADLDRWLSRMDSETEALGGGDTGAAERETRQKRLQIVKSEIPHGQARLEEFQAISCQVTNDFGGEDVTKVKLNLEQMNVRWASLMSKISNQSRELGSPGSSSGDIMSEKMASWLDNAESRLTALSQDSIDPLGSNTTVKGRILDSVKELQLDIESRANDLIAMGATPDLSKNSGLTQDFNLRWNTLRDKTSDLRSSLENGGAENLQLFLNRLRELNEWLANKDSDFREQQYPIGGDLISVQRQHDAHKCLLQELTNQKGQIDSILHQGQRFMDDSLDKRSLHESEGESDGSESQTDDRSKRVTRRIRRNLHHLSKRWTEMGPRVKEHQEKLSVILQRMSLLEEVMNEVESRLQSAESEIDQWASVAHIHRDRHQKEMDKIENFQKQFNTISNFVESLNTQANELQEINVVLSHKLVSRLESFKNRLNSIKSETRSRQAHLSESARRESSAQAPVPLPAAVTSGMPVYTPDSGLKSSVQSPWERCLHPSGNSVPFYKNHLTQQTQWDHPVMSDLTQALQDFNSIRFSAYRTAMKLRALQKELCLDLVNLSIALEAFHHHGLHTADNDRLLDVTQLVACLNTIYTSVDTKRGPGGLGCDPISSNGATSCGGGNVGCGSALRQSSRRRRPLSSHYGANDVINGGNGGTGASWLYAERRVTVTLCVDLALNWLLNVYDCVRNGRIRVLSFKTALVLLCTSHLEEKYRYLFATIADAESSVDQRRLGLLLHDCILIPRQLGEAAFFGGSNIEPSVRSCFEKMEEIEERENPRRAYLFDDGSREQLSVRLNHFMAWLRLEPQSLVWIPVLHRLSASANAVHHLKCGVCRVTPIRGLRYRCLRCLNVDLCQNCFFTGKISKSHKLTHPMQEYWNHTTSSENIRDISRIMRNRLRSKEHFKKPSKLGYLPVQTVDEGQAVNSATSTPNHSLTRGMHNRMEAYATRLAEVEHQRQGRSSSVMEMDHQRHGRSSSAMELPPGSGSLQRRQVNTLSPGYSSGREGDEEHSLIARYSQSLRRKSNPDGPGLQSPMQIMMSMTSSLGPDDPAFQGFSHPSTPRHRDPLLSPQHSFRRPQQHPQSPMFIQHPTPSSDVMSRSLNASYGTPEYPGGSGRKIDGLLHNLESEHRQLQAEYDRLRSQTPTPGGGVGGRMQRPPNQNHMHLMNQYGSPGSGGHHLSTSSGLVTNPGLNAPSVMMGGSLGRHALISPVGGGSSTSGIGGSAVEVDEMVQEARQLRQHKGRLEARMQILEDHNKQLESQLNRLRQLLTTTGGSSPAPNQNSSASDAELYTSQQYATARRSQSYLSPPTQHMPPSSLMGYSTLSGGNTISHLGQHQPRNPQVQMAYQQTNQYQMGSGSPSTPHHTNNKTPYLFTGKPRAASETGGSLSDTEFNEMCHELADSCPTVPYAASKPMHGSIGSLFHKAGQVGQAMGQLVTVMNNNLDSSTPPPLSTSSTSTPSKPQTSHLPPTYSTPIQ